MSRLFVGTAVLLLAMDFGKSSLRADTPTPQSRTQVTTVYLVRHAEKTSEQADELSPRGEQRAKALARVLADVTLDRVFSTNFARTKQTVRHAADARGLSVETYQSSAKLADRISTGQAGSCVLIAAHSNTIPEIIAALGGKAPQISDEYDNLFIITISRCGPAAPIVNVQRLRYSHHID